MCLCLLCAVERGCKVHKLKAAAEAALLAHGFDSSMEGLLLAREGSRVSVGHTNSFTNSGSCSGRGAPCKGASGSVGWSCGIACQSVM
jgi:hypothetical protein